MEKKKKRIVVIGDSQTVPRPEDDMYYEKTFPFLLASALANDFDVVGRGRRANTTNKQAQNLNLQDDITGYKPNLVIIHLGVVDCAPRLFTEFQQKILEKLPTFIRSRILKFFSERREFFTRRFRKVYVKPEVFKKNVNTISLFVKELGAKAIWMGIAPSAKRVEGRSFNYESNRIEYSNYIKENALLHGQDYLDVAAFIREEKHLLPDGIHYNPQAHHDISLRLLERVKTSHKI